MPEMERFTDAIALLKADHRNVEALFDEFAAARGADKKQRLARSICVELKVHMAIEEEIFYPAFRGQIEDTILNEAYVEHDAAKVLINDINSARATEDFFDAKVTVLFEEIRHHVHEEEAPSEGMFSQCRATNVDLVDLRDALVDRKRELKKLAGSAGLPRAEPHAVNLQPA